MLTAVPVQCIYHFISDQKFCFQWNQCKRMGGQYRSTHYLFVWVYIGFPACLCECITSQLNVVN